MEPTKFERDINRILFSDAFLVALLIPISYTLCYAYQLGYLAEFGIPFSFAEFKITQILERFDQTLLEIFGLFLSYIFIYFIIPEQFKTVLYGVFLPVFSACAFLIYILWIYFFFWNDININLLSDLLFRVDISTGIVILVIFIFLNPKFIPVRNENYINNYQKIVRSPLFITISIFILTYLYFFEAGHVDAHTKQDFLIANTKPECVVLYIREDSLICAEYFKENQAFSTDFRIIYPANNPNIHFQKIHTGRIHESKTLPLLP